jgi:hypothetical protein
MRSGQSCVYRNVRAPPEQNGQTQRSEECGAYSSKSYSRFGERDHRSGPEVTVSKTARKNKDVHVYSGTHESPDK